MIIIYVCFTRTFSSIFLFFFSFVCSFVYHIRHCYTYFVSSVNYKTRVQNDSQKTNTDFVIRRANKNVKRYKKSYPPPLRYPLHVSYLHNLDTNVAIFVSTDAVAGAVERVKSTARSSVRFE